MRYCLARCRGSEACRPTGSSCRIMETAPAPLTCRAGSMSGNLPTCESRDKPARRRKRASSSSFGRGALSWPFLVLYTSFMGATAILFLRLHSISSPMEDLGVSFSSSGRDTPPAELLPPASDHGRQTQYRALSNHPKLVGQARVAASKLRGSAAAGVVIVQHPLITPRTGRAAELESLFRDLQDVSRRTETLTVRVQALRKRVRPGPKHSGPESPLAEEIRMLEAQAVNSFKTLMDLEKRIAAFRMREEDSEEDPVDVLLPFPKQPRAHPASQQDRRQQQEEEKESDSRQERSRVDRKVEEHSEAAGAGGGEGMGEAGSEQEPAAAIGSVAQLFSSDNKSSSGTSAEGRSSESARAEERRRRPVVLSQSPLVGPDWRPAPAKAQLPDLGPTASVVKVARGENEGCRTADCRLLLTGCGRSGTHFLADMLQHNGYNVTHERIGPQGSVSWVFAAPSSPDSMADESRLVSAEDVWRRSQANFTFYPIVHLTRHPVPLITSLTTCFCGCGSIKCGRWADTPSWHFAGHVANYSNEFCRMFNKEGTCLEYTSQMGRLKRAMEYYVSWNELIEKQAHYRARMEGLNLVELLAVSGLYHGGDVLLPPRGFKSTAKGRKVPVTWESMLAADPLLTKRIADMALRYGYQKDAPPMRFT